MIIRSITATDIPAAAELLRDSWRYHAQHSRLQSLKAMMDYPIETHLQERLTLSEWATFVADDGEIIGVVMCCIEDAPSYYKFPKQLFVHEIAVAEDHRRQGIAEKLLHRAEEFASSQDISLLVADIYDFNTSSQSLFAKDGFNPDISYWYKVSDKGEHHE